MAAPAFSPRSLTLAQGRNPRGWRLALGPPHAPATHVYTPRGAHVSLDVYAPSTPLLAASSHCPSGPRDGGRDTKTNEPSGSSPSAPRAGDTTSVPRTTGRLGWGREGRAVLHVPPPRDLQPPVRPPRPFWATTHLPRPHVRPDAPFSAFLQIFKKEQMSLSLSKGGRREAALRPFPASLPADLGAP